MASRSCTPTKDESVEADEAEIAAEPSPLVEGIRAELKRLIDREPFTPGVVNRIKKIAAQSYKLMVAIDPTHKQPRPRGFGNYEDYEPDDVIDGEEPAYSLNSGLGGSAPFSGPETFGANVIRELVPLLTKLVGDKKKPDLPAIPDLPPVRGPDDWESTGSLIHAYRQANDAGLKDVADSIMARIEGRTDPDLKEAVQQVKRSKALVPYTEGTPDVSFATPGAPDISCAPPEEIEPEPEPDEMPEPEPEPEPDEMLVKYGVRKPDEDACHSGPFDTLDEAQKHSFPPDDEIVELPGGRVVEMNITTPGTAELPAP